MLAAKVVETATATAAAGMAVAKAVEMVTVTAAGMAVAKVVEMVTATVEERSADSIGCRHSLMGKHDLAV